MELWKISQNTIQMQKCEYLHSIKHTIIKKYYIWANIQLTGFIIQQQLHTNLIRLYISSARKCYTTPLYSCVQQLTPRKYTVQPLAIAGTHLSYPMLQSSYLYIIWKLTLPQFGPNAVRIVINIWVVQYIWKCLHKYQPVKLSNIVATRICSRQ